MLRNTVDDFDEGLIDMEGLAGNADYSSNLVWRNIFAHSAPFYLKSLLFIFPYAYLIVDWQQTKSNLYEIQLAVSPYD